MEDKKIVNNSTVEEAIEKLKEEKINIIGESIVFYMKYEEEVDEKPEQLIGIENEESLVEEMNMRYLPVVGVGKNVQNVKVGDKVFMEDRMFGATSYFTAGSLKYGLLPIRMINVIKSA